MQRSHVRRGSAVLALAALAACSDAPTSTPVADLEKPRSEFAERVEALGFRGDMVEDHGDYVLVEGDIYIPKAQLTAPRAELKRPDGPRYQYRTTNLVGSAKVYNITVDLSGLASQPGWQTAARDAITHWSGITDSNVRLTEVTGAADITVTTTCTSWNVAASASFPSGGNPGNVIYVNTCFGYSTSHGQKVHNMVHELGHTLGFRHSNYTQLGEGASTVGAVHIWNTPTSGNATGSVMNGGTALNSWAGFAASDLTATRSIYPLPSPSGLSVTDSGGYPLVSWNAPSGATSYTVTLITYEYNLDQYGQEWYQGRWFTQLATTTSTSYLDTSASYTGTPYCTYPDPFDPWGTSMKRNWYEYAVQATYPNGTSHIDNGRIYAPVGQQGWGGCW